MTQRVITTTYAQNPAARTVWNEVPGINGSGNWVLKNYPNPGDAAECFYNGVHQTPNLDYSLRGSQLFSTLWSASDLSGNLATLTCNYTY